MTIGKVDTVQAFVHVVSSSSLIVFGYLADLEMALTGRENHNILETIFNCCSKISVFKKKYASPYCKRCLVFKLRNTLLLFYVFSFTKYITFKLITPEKFDFLFPEQLKLNKILGCFELVTSLK